MSTKIALTITPDTEYLAPEEIDAAMARTITTLQRLGLVPLRKITIAIECKDEDAADLEDTIDAALSARPVGIEVVLKTTKERHVTRDTAIPRVTPMDKEWQDFADKNNSTITGTLFGQRIDVAPVGSDAPPRR
jgi:hypothetical protein